MEYVPAAECRACTAEFTLCSIYTAGGPGSGSALRNLLCSAAFTAFCRTRGTLQHLQHAAKLQRPQNSLYSAALTALCSICSAREFAVRPRTPRGAEKCSSSALPPSHSRQRRSFPHYPAVPDRHNSTPGTPCRPGRCTKHKICRTLLPCPYGQPPSCAFPGQEGPRCVHPGSPGRDLTRKQELKQETRPAPAARRGRVQRGF